MKLMTEKFLHLLALIRNPSVYPYFGLAFVLAATFRIHTSGDDMALLTGLDHALGCLSNSPVRLPCGAEVVHFPIYQYLVATPFKLIGFSNSSIISIFGILSFAWSIVACATFWRAGWLSANKIGGHLGVAVLLSGYFLWYLTSSFNEATSFTLFAILVLSIIDEWRISYVCIIALVATLTKEVAFPFIVYFGYIAFLAREINCGQYSTFGKNLLKFIQKYKYAGFCVMIGILINLIFNYFRFGSFKNLSNLTPEFFTPWSYVPDFFLYLFISPAGGLIFVWCSLSLLLLVPFIFFRRKNSSRLIVGLALLGLVTANFGLARWYSPFGWSAWGPRLTLPFLGAVGILCVYVCVHQIVTFMHGEFRKKTVFLIFAIIAASALPNIAVVLDQTAFFSRMFQPTKVAEDSQIKDFKVQTAPTELYMAASMESFSRNIVIPTTIQVISKNWIYIGIWLSSLFLIFRQIIISIEIILKKSIGSSVPNVDSSSQALDLFVKSREFFFFKKWMPIVAGIFLGFIGGVLLTRFSTSDLFRNMGLGWSEAHYHLIPQQVTLVEGLDNFPAHRSLAQIHINLNTNGNLDAVSVSASGGVGQWTSLPISHLWGVGVLEKNGEIFRIGNEGARKSKLNYLFSNTLTFWIPDNGSLGKCPKLKIDLLLSDGRQISTLAACNDEISSVSTTTAVTDVHTDIRYQHIASQESLVHGLENFPAKRSLIEIKLNLSSSESVESVGVLASDGLGQWTTLPIDHLWGIGIIDTIGDRYLIRNAGPRKDKLDILTGKTLTLWMPDNGNLPKCPKFKITVKFKASGTHLYDATCKTL